MSSPTPESQDASVLMPLHKFEGHTDSVTGVVHLPGGRWIITCSKDGSLRVWNMESGLQVGEDWRDGDSPVHAIALSPDGKKIVSGSEDGAVRLWNTKTGEMIAKWTGYTNAVQYVYWSRHGRRVVSGCQRDGTAREWDVESGESILGLLQTGHTLMWAFAYSPAKAMIATAGVHPSTCGPGVKYSEEVWDVKTRKLVTTLKGHRRPINIASAPPSTYATLSCLAWTADGKKLVTGSGDGTIGAWDTTTWEEIAFFTTLNLLLRIDAMAISPNGRILAIASEIDGGALLNLENGQHIVSQSQPTTCVTFSSDGKLQSSGYGARNEPNSEDYNINIHDVAVILKECGLDDLLLDATDDDKPLLDADATLRSAQQLEGVRRTHREFFDETRHHIRSPSSRLAPPSARNGHATAAHISSGPREFLRGFSLLSRHSEPRIVHDEPSPSHLNPFNWTRVLFSGQLLQRDQRDTEFIEGNPAVVEVPHTRGQHRNVRVRRRSEKKIPDPINIMTINVTGTSQLPNSSTAQQYTGDASGQQPSSEPQLAVNPTPAAATTTSTTTTPLYSEHHIMIRQTGWWTRFWLSLGCISAENHH